MPINTPNILRKKDAIAAKDVAKITALKVYIPGLGESYTEEQLKAWLDEIVNQLDEMLTFTKEEDITQKKTALYASLSVAEKTTADKTLAGDDNVRYATEAEWLKQRPIRVFHFATEPTATILNQEAGG